MRKIRSGRDQRKNLCVMVFENMARQGRIALVFINNLTPRSKYRKGHAGYNKALEEEGAPIGTNATVVCSWFLCLVFLPGLKAGDENVKKRF